MIELDTMSASGSGADGTDDVRQRQRRPDAPQSTRDMRAMLHRIDTFGPDGFWRRVSVIAFACLAFSFSMSLIILALLGQVNMLPPTGTFFASFGAVYVAPITIQPFVAGLLVCTNDATWDLVVLLNSLFTGVLPAGLAFASALYVIATSTSINANIIEYVIIALLTALTFLVVVLQTIYAFSLLPVVTAPVRAVHRIRHEAMRAWLPAARRH